MDHGSSGSVITWPFSTRVRLPEAYWRVAPAETLTFGMNAATAERDPAAAVLVWPCAWTAWGEFRCASSRASESEMGRAMESDATTHGPSACAAAVLSGDAARALPASAAQAAIAIAAAMNTRAAFIP